MPSLGTMERTITPLRQRSPMGGLMTFLSGNCCSPLCDRIYAKRSGARLLVLTVPVGSDRGNSLAEAGKSVSVIVLAPGSRIPIALTKLRGSRRYNAPGGRVFKEE